MANNNSDRNGRALEYKIANTLGKNKNFELTDQCAMLNERDFHKFQDLSSELQNNFEIASNKITNWIAAKVLKNFPVQVERINDSPNVVADIAIIGKGASLNLSIKHNHHALKHPRPYSLAQSCGYPLKSPQDAEHRALMDVAANDFRNSADGLSHFNQCPSVAIDTLYANVCNACVNSIKSWTENDSSVANKLFFFLVNSGFYKIIVETKKDVVVKIQDYNFIKAPTSVFATTNGNRLIMQFNNGWEINLRIHTAASKISRSGSQLSLKFDVQKTKGTIKEFEI
jgi:hypothetical protein